MITEFSLENFKAFAAMQSIPIKPITLIYGANSSGKSSIIQAWLMLKQTLEEKRDGTSDLLSSGTLVDLGSFRELVNSHDQSKHVAIKFEFGDDEEAQIRKRNTLVDFVEHSAYFAPENLEEALDFPEKVEIGVKLLVSPKEKARKAVLDKIEIYFLSKEPLLIYRLESSGSKVAMILETISEGHHFFKQLWEKNKEKLEGLIYAEIISSLGNFDYNVSARSREEIPEFLRNILKKRNKEIAEININEIKLRDIELKESQEVEALRSQRENIEKEIRKLGEDRRKLDEEIENIRQKISTDSAYIEDKLNELYFQHGEVELKKNRLEQDVERIKEPLSLKELRLRELREQKSSQSSLDKLESDLEELNSLLEFWNYTDGIEFSGYLDLLRQSFNGIFDLGFNNFSPKFQDNPSKSLKNYYLAKAFEQLNASISLLNGITSICLKDLEDALSNTHYLGPLREAPRRYYEARQSTGKDLDKHGSFAIEKLYNDQNGDSSLTKMVNEYFKKLGLKYTISVRTIEHNDSQSLDMQSLYAVRLIENGSGCDVNISNVGFGISQVLPVIVQSIASKGNVILIEQPELHIHPKLQTELGQLFADCIKSPLNNFFVIETHSEHILARLKKLIRNGNLSKDDISVVFVDKDPDSSRCLNLRISQKGHLLDRFPKGFFDEDYREKL